MKRLHLAIAMLAYNIAESVQVIAGDAIRAEQSRRWARAEKRQRAAVGSAKEWN